MDVVVEFGRSKGAGMECDRMDFTVFRLNRQNSRKGVVGCVSFHNNFGIGYPVSENRSPSKGLLQSVESLLTFGSEIPADVFLGKSCKGNSDGTVIVVHEVPIEIAKAKERLNVLDLMRHRPVRNNFESCLYANCRERGCSRGIR